MLLSRIDDDGALNHAVVPKSIFTVGDSKDVRKKITILEGDGWQLQLDNQLPKELKQGHLYTIPEMEYHRLIKGTGKLVVKIWEEKHD